MSKTSDEQVKTDTIAKKPSKNVAILKIVGILLLVVVFGIYVGDMLFGTSSLDVLLNLQMDKEDLQKKVLHLKAENAKLQKEYFELYQLDFESQ